MGSDFGQWNEWNSNQSIDWHLLEFDSNAGVKNLISHLNYLYRTEPSLYQKDCDGSGFEWISFDNVDESIISWIRKGENEDDITLFVANFTPVPHSNYRVGVPRDGLYQEILNSDSEMYFGSNIGNYGGRWSELFGCNGREHSISIEVPPLAVVGFKLTK